MNANDFVSINHILSESLTRHNDEALRNGFSRGWYVSRIQDAIQELAFDTFFFEITRDFDFPDNFILEMPKDAFNIKEIHLFNGGCCKPESSSVVHWKRTYNNKGGGTDYTARIKEIGESGYFDPFLPNEGYSRNSYYGGVKLFANIQNGMIMFSSDSSSYEKVRLIYNSMGGEIGDLPIIPRFFERAVNDYVSHKYYESMQSRDPRLYGSLENKYYARLNDPRDGSWKKARMRSTSMDSWEKESMNEYISSMIHK